MQRRVEPFDVLPGWCLELSGAASGSDLTDGSGIYAFNGLAAGKYLVCLVVPSGWRQTHPSSGASDALCPSGNYGRKFTADGGSGASGMWFGVVPQ